MYSHFYFYRPYAYDLIPGGLFIQYRPHLKSSSASTPPETRWFDWTKIGLVKYGMVRGLHFKTSFFFCPNSLDRKVPEVLNGEES